MGRSSKGRSSKGLAEFGRAVAEKTQRRGVLDTDEGREAAEELRLYIALCVIGAMRFVIQQWVAKRLHKVHRIGIVASAVHFWIKKDPACRELLEFWRENGPETENVSEWLAKARAYRDTEMVSR